MTKTTISLLGLILASMILTGCTKNAEFAPGPAEGSPSNVTVGTQSTGDVDQDIQAMEDELDTLNTDSDWPGYDETDFE